MERIQVYPPDELKAIMDKDAKDKGLSISELAVEILMDHYTLGLETKKKPLSELSQQIFEEVEDFIRRKTMDKDSDPAEEIQFDLLSASKTFKDIHMVANGKPSMNRAVLGKQFSGRVKEGFGVYGRVEPVYDDEGKPKKSVNRAQMYRIV